MSERAVLVERILGPLARQNSTATVLFHHAVAERLGLGPTDHKCLDLIQQRGTATGSELAAITGLTTGAVTGVVNRLERAGFVRRTPDPQDGRRQLLTPVADRLADIAEIFDSITEPAEALLAGFDLHQLEAIAEFLTRSTEFATARAATLRAQVLSSGGRTRRARQP